MFREPARMPQLNPVKGINKKALNKTYASAAQVPPAEMKKYMTELQSGKKSASKPAKPAAKKVATKKPATKKVAPKRVAAKLAAKPAAKKRASSPKGWKAAAKKHRGAAKVKTKKLELQVARETARAKMAERQLASEKKKTAAARKAVVSTGRVSPTPTKQETRTMAKTKSTKKPATKKAPKRKPAKGRKPAKRAAAKKVATTTTSTPKPKRRRTARRIAASAAFAVAGKGGKKGHRTVKRANLKRGLYMDRKGQVRRVNPTTETKHMMVKVGGLAIGLILAEGLDRYLATRGTEKHEKPYYGTGAAAAIRSKSDGMRLFAQAAGAGVLGIGAYLLRNKSAYATSALGGLAAGFGIKLFVMAITDHVMPALLKAKTADEATLANRLYADKQATQEAADTAAVTGAVGGGRFFRGNPMTTGNDAGSVGTAKQRVQIAFGDVFGKSTGAVGCSLCGATGGCRCGKQQSQRGPVDVTGMQPQPSIEVPSTPETGEEAVAPVFTPVAPTGPRMSEAVPTVPTFSVSQKPAVPVFQPNRQPNRRGVQAVPNYVVRDDFGRVAGVK